MAEYWSNNDRGYCIKLVIDQVSQSVEKNTSTVRIRLTLFNTDRTFSMRQCKWYVDGFGQYIGDVSYFEISRRNSVLQIVDKTITVKHDNGNKFNVKAFFYSYGNADGPYELTIGPTAVTLDSIDNTSTFEFPSNVVIGDEYNVVIKKRVSSAKHILKCSWHRLEDVVADNIDGSYKWRIPDKYANEIPNEASSWGTLYLETYINGKLVGTRSEIFTASLSLLRAKPSFSRIALADANEKTRNITQSDRHYVSVLSKIYAHFDNVQAYYGAAITRYFMEIVGNNNTISAPSGTFREISVNKDTQFTLRGYVEDSRGLRSEIEEITITVLNYFSPTLKFEVVRSGATNSTLTIKRFAKVAPLTVNGVQKNPMKLTFTTRNVDSDTETIDNGGAGGTWSQISAFNASNANLGNSYPADTSYIVVGKLEDVFTNVSFQVTVPSDRVVMSYDKDGVGINKYREIGALDVDGLIYSSRKQIQHYKLTEPDGVAINTKADNLNNYKDTGFYSIAGNYVNHPALGEGGFLEVVKSGFGSLQTLTTVSGRMFKRIVTSNSTGTWIEYTPKPENPEPATIRRTIPMGFGISAEIVRKNNLVTLSLIRDVKSINVCENRDLTESIPTGFRPALRCYLLANKNFANEHIGVAVWDILTDGSMKLNNPDARGAVHLGTVTYITEDN